MKLAAPTLLTLGTVNYCRASATTPRPVSRPIPIATAVQLLAQAKAQAVRDACTDASITVVLGCGSVLAFEGEVFGKPNDAAEAIARWQLMAGGGGRSTTTRVQFAPLRLAGGFALEGRGGFVVERIDCC